MGNRELTERALVTEMVRWLGIGGSARLIGLLMLAALNGAESRHDLLETPFASRTTRWRVLRDVNALRDHLADLGYDLAPEELAGLIVRAGSLPAM